MSTIIDVAKQAGVSFKTVSRVLNGEPGVRDETRRKVLSAVEALDYRVNVSARNLRAQSATLVCLLFDNPSRAYAHDLQVGAGRGCRNAGYGLLVEDDVSPETLNRLTAREDILGYIIGAPQSDDGALVQRLKRTGRPLIRVATETALHDTHHISINESQAAQTAAAHAVALGHREIAIIAGPQDSQASNLRLEGYWRALSEAGITFREDLIDWGEFDFASGLRIAERFLSDVTSPSMILAANDDMAAGALAAAYKLGRRVPDELSIIGFDDSPVASVVYPSLTTIRQSTSDMAETAVELLQQMRRGKDPAHTGLYTDHELIVRESTAPYRALA